MFTNQQFEDNLTQAINAGGLPGGGNIAGLKSFITERRNSLQIQLAVFGCFLGIQDATIPQVSFLVFPNPSDDYITMSFQHNPDNELGTMKIFDYSGKLLLLKECTGNSIKINISAFKPGLYLITYNGIASQKFQIIR